MYMNKAILYPFWSGYGTTSNVAIDILGSQLVSVLTISSLIKLDVSGVIGSNSRLSICEPTDGLNILSNGFVNNKFFTDLITDWSS
jgi:hypothetical protein